MKKKQNWKIFWLTFIPIFILVSLQHFGIHAPRFISPLSKTVNVMDNVLPKLDEKKNTFHLSRPISLVANADAASDYDQAPAYEVIDLDTGRVLTEKNADERLPIASLTKIMSSIVTLDLVKPSDIFTITPPVTHVVPTIIGLSVGEKVDVSMLLKGMLMTSANDAAQAVKEGVDTEYKAPVFINAMNAKAKLLGLSNTHYANPQGFDDPNNYSTAADLAVLSHYALTNYPLIDSIAQEDYEYVPETADHGAFKLYNWNGLLDVYPGVFGLKIGNTGQAKTTMVVGAKRDGKRVLVVILGAPDIVKRDLWASELLDVGFEKLDGLPPVNVTEADLYAKYSTWNS